MMNTHFPFFLFVDTPGRPLPRTSLLFPAMDVGLAYSQPSRHWGMCLSLCPQISEQSRGIHLNMSQGTACEEEGHAKR